jgi:GNAT superfamily N-acetyltransferase
MPETPDIAIRLAHPADAPVIAHQRACMFREMGQLTEAAFPELRDRATMVLEQWLKSGDYVGWLAVTVETGRVVAGAGCQRRAALPHPRTPDTVGVGRQAIVLNVYTEPEWRRRGLAERLMREVLTWARLERLDRLVLHASTAGRPLYERLGFVATNEMRFPGSFD